MIYIGELVELNSGSPPLFVSHPTITIRDGYQSHAFDSEKLEIYLFVERFHYKNGGWLIIFKWKNVWFTTVPKNILDILNKIFTSGIKTQYGYDYVKLTFNDEKDFVLFGMRFVLGDESPLDMLSIGIENGMV